MGPDSFEVILFFRRWSSWFLDPSFWWLDLLMFSVELFRFFSVEGDVSELNCVAVVLLGQFVLLVFELEVRDVIVADTSILVVLSVEHRAHASQLHDGEAIFHLDKVIVHAFLIPNQVPEHVVQLIDLETLVAGLVS
jgi:hypothetical protein